MNNLPMAFCWRGISSSSVAARTAFVDREPPPPIVYLTYEQPKPVAVTPAPVAAEPERKAAEPRAETLLFAVAEEQPTRGDRGRFKYTSAIDAERAARRIVTGRGGSMGIWLHDAKSFPVEVATVLRDSLDRVWTQVNAKPGERAFL